METPFEKHFLAPETAGELENPDGSGQAGEPGCGAVIRIDIRFRGESIDEAGFLASGAPSAIVVASILTGLVRGGGWRTAAAISPGQLISAARRSRGDESPPADAAMLDRAASFAVEALHLALEDALRRDRFPAAPAVDESAVMVAMSGGVDSSTACLLLHEEGRQVTGVTMRLWEAGEEEPAAGPSCCSPEAIIEARSVCHSLGLPHLTVDCTTDFATGVIENFISEYRDGRTPNPCVRCNGEFRFPALMKLADRLGAADVATGHYARVLGKGGEAALARGVDRRKDQSYMLAGIDPALLGRLVLPLGKMKKRETRERARLGGLAAHARRESQDICFIPDGDYRLFLRRRGGVQAGGGDVVDTAGRKIGTHEGYYAYTVGQRRGLKVSAPGPLYVLGTDPARNLVIAGEHARLATSLIELDGVRQLRPLDEAAGLEVQVRYNSPPVGVRRCGRRGSRWYLELEEPVFGVAPGQTAVIYGGEVVIAAGSIEKTAGFAAARGGSDDPPPGSF